MLYYSIFSKNPKTKENNIAIKSSGTDKSVNRTKKTLYNPQKIGKNKMTTINNTSKMNNNNNGNNTMNNQIFSHYDALVTTLTFRTGSSDTAHDIAMDGLIKACEKVGQYDSSKGTLKNFVYTVVLNNMRDFYKSHAVKMTGSGYDPDTIELLAGGYEMNTDEIDFGGMHSAWEIAEWTLNRKEYIILTAYFQDNLKYREIAKKYNIPIGSVMSALSSAKSKLAQSSSFQECKYLID